MVRLAIDGGNPVRYNYLPYGKQTITHNDIKAVNDVLRSDYLTTGPMVSAFEEAFAVAVGAKSAVAVSSGTAALHAIMDTIGISNGDEVIVPTMTFAATANCVKYCGGTPVFVDVDPATLLVNPDSVFDAITDKTVAIIAVDYAGHPCPYDQLKWIAVASGISLVADACHSLGGQYHNVPVGDLADFTAFSLHPVKHITTGEGGMVTTDSLSASKYLRGFRSHGRIDGEMFYLGYNYRLTDIQCALGLSQLDRLADNVVIRRDIAKEYDTAFISNDYVTPLSVSDTVYHAYHLYVVKLNLNRLTVTRDIFLDALRAEGIGATVHYKPVHMQPYYDDINVSLPVAEDAYTRILSLPIFPEMSKHDVADVVSSVNKVTREYSI